MLQGIEWREFGGMREALWSQMEHSLLPGKLYMQVDSVVSSNIRSLINRPAFYHSFHM